MTSPLPPKRRDSRNLADLLRQDRTRLGQLDRGLVGGRFPGARPLKATSESDLEDDDGPDDLIQGENRDTATCSGPNAPIRIVLSHVPEDGTEQVFYNGTPLKRTDWSRTDTVLTIPGEPWFRAGKVAWVHYLYYDSEIDQVTPTLVGTTSVTTNHTSIPIPAGTQAGDLLVLTLAARDAAACTDPRFDAGYHHTSSLIFEYGIWFGTADGTGTPVSITLDSTAADGGIDCCGALAAFTGLPLTITAEATSSGTIAPLVPTMPSAGSFGVAGLVMNAGLVAGSINDEATASWTTAIRVQGPGSGKSSVYIGYSTNGIPAGTWNSTGGAEHWDARIGGIQ